MTELTFSTAFKTPITIGREKMLISLFTLSKTSWVIEL